MEILYTALLVMLAFWFGACPFSVWIGKWLLTKDVRDYGDRNPGAYNVMRAGGRKAFALALFLDIGKGVPFVALAYYCFELPDMVVMVIGLSAILGHAFTPVLRFNGGKALAVTGGVLLALPQHEMFVSVIIFMLLCFLLVDVDAWRVIIALTSALVYLVVIKGLSIEPLFMLCVIMIIAAKHFDDLRTTRPRFKGRLITWLKARRTAHLSRQ